MVAAALARSIKSALLALFLLASVPSLLWADDVKFSSELLTVISAGGKKHQFLVELAVTGEQRERGLMFRKSMDKDAGMLFDFGVPRPVMMWMKNTDLPLDMLFIGADGDIHRIHHDAVPYAETIIDSGGPVKYVLEINGGRAAQLKIREGDHVVSPQIGNLK